VELLTYDLDIQPASTGCQETRSKFHQAKCSSS